MCVCVCARQHGHGRGRCGEESVHSSGEDLLPGARVGQGRAGPDRDPHRQARRRKLIRRPTHPEPVAALVAFGTQTNEQTNYESEIFDPRIKACPETNGVCPRREFSEIGPSATKRDDAR
eukprot:9047852-Pyramimonas_sp.AAC.1